MGKTYEKELENGRLLVYGVDGNEEIKQRIAPIYPPERIQEGINLYQATRSAFEEQHNEQIELKEANQKFGELQLEMGDRLMKIRKAGRYFFKNEAEWNRKLRLQKEVPSSFASWKHLAQETVNAIRKHEEIQVKLSLVDLTPEQIADFDAKLTQLEELKLQAKKEDGEAQQATLRKNETFDQFRAYCSDLRACLNLFYDGTERQKLEQVGIVVK